MRRRAECATLTALTTACAPYPLAIHLCACSLSAHTVLVIARGRRQRAQTARVKDCAALRGGLARICLKGARREEKTPGQTRIEGGGDEEVMGGGGVVANRI